jgi:hypothetical protein
VDGHLFDHQDIGSSVPGLDGGGKACEAAADDDDVGLVIPLRGNASPAAEASRVRRETPPRAIPAAAAAPVVFRKLRLVNDRGFSECSAMRCLLSG